MNHDDRHDDALITQAQDGSRKAFAEIYERHFQAIYTYVFYRVGDAMLAEDLTAEVFVRLVDKIHTFVAGQRPILAWLYTIARNLVIDSQRKNKTPLFSVNENIETDHHNPAKTVEMNSELAELIKAIGHLTEDQKHVILLKFVEGHSNEVTARILGKTEGAVKSLQHRALNALSRAMEFERGLP